MLNEKITEQLVERLVERIEKGNTYVLKKIGESIKKIGSLSPTSAQALGQTLKYGGDYNEIVKELAKVTGMNVRDIYKIFDEVAKKDYQFAKQFYDYKGVKYIPYEENIELQRQVRTIARITVSKYVNLSNTLGFSLLKNNRRVFTPLYKAYSNAIDEAVISVAQGKDTFDNQMFKTLKELANSGIRTTEFGERKVDWASGYSRRLDSSLRMNMQSALRDLHNEMQQQFGEEFGADGVEISVHLNPAPDHALIQGKQFSIAEFDKFQHDEDAVSYDGQLFPAEFEGHDRRSISEYNCYHYIFSIVLGVSKPDYSKEKLEDIINKNNKGFTYEGKHYTNYEGTQMQRKLETEIRKQKDAQIMGRSAGNKDLINESQQKITQLTQKYNELCKISGLPRKADRLRVSGYQRVAKNKLK